jgi:hypothetical protein
MRDTCIGIAFVLAAAVAGCESPTPPTAMERAESAPSPPVPEEPPKPPTEEELKAKAAEAAGGVNILEGKAAIERAKAAMAGKKKARDAQPAEGAAPPDGSAPAPPAAEPSAPAEADAATPPAAEAPGTAPPPADQPPPEGDALSKAEVGVGVKGKGYGGPGFITTPIETYFTAQDRIDFEIQIPHGMKLYKAAHDNKGPKTHEEFMNVIIKEQGIKLPELPVGSVYWYNAKTEELMVRTPKAK